MNDQEIEKEFFEEFITVSGIGPKAALRALNMPISSIARAIDADSDAEKARAARWAAVRCSVIEEASRSPNSRFRPAPARLPPRAMPTIYQGCP